MKKEVIAQKDPKSPISEVFRTLRTNIQFMNSSKKMKTLLITSTLPGEGKSYVSSNLAVTFAQAGKKVILIDADMRKGRLYSIFDILPRPGLSNYLSNVDIEDGENKNIYKYIQQTEVENLGVISAGNIPPNPSELLISEQMSNLLEELKQICDLVIIDGTPCELVTDSVILSRIVDSTVIVAAAKQTKKDNLGRVIENIQNVGGKLAGVVLNKIPMSAKKYGETYYYGSTAKNMNKKQNKKEIAKINREEIFRRTSNTLINDINKKVEEQPEIENTFENSNKSTISVEKTNDILNQINSYLENEKKDLNN